MDLAAIERSIRDAGAVVVDPRLLRRVIKRHRSLPGLGLQVPHTASYALRREDLLALVEPSALGEVASSLPEEVVLLPRPTPEELFGKTPDEILTSLWQAAFHGQIHLEMERRVAQGSLTDAAVRERIDHIGQIEFDEIRSILRHDDLLLPPHSDREAYTEFVAIYLGLTFFTPDLVDQVFPSLRDASRVEATIASDIADARAILDRCRPAGAPLIKSAARAPSKKRDTTTPTYSSLPTLGIFSALTPKTPRKVDITRANAAADALRAKGNVVGAALLRAAALGSAPPAQEMRLRAEVRADLDILSERLTVALRPLRDRAGEPASVEWTSLLLMLAEEAGPKRGLRYPVEARLLYDLQAACVASERPINAVDVVTWALSLGKRPIIRPLPATRELRIARDISAASAKLRHVYLADNADRKLLARTLRWAKDRAEANVRDALRPRITSVLAAVGLKPASIPEEIARDKVVEELLDEALDRGFFSIGHVRDALSRSQLKLEDLSSPRELLSGDALLLCDVKLAIELDGVYRPGEIYLRFLQKVSSLAFGTTVGRAITLYLVLPLVSAFVLLEGVSHMIGFVMKGLGAGTLNLVTRTSFAITTIVIFALLHSDAIRAIASRALRITLRVLGAVLIRFPRWLFGLPTVRAFLASTPVRAALRFAILPGAAAALAYYATPLRSLSTVPGVAGAAIVFAITSFILNTSVSILLEEVFLDWLVRKWRMVRSRVLPGLFRLILDFFKTLLELFERGIYKVDEWLRFRQGEHMITLGLKAAAGLVWFAVTYVIRLYVVLLIEPEVNPIKHFPVVTVAHKIVLPFTPPLLNAMQSALSPLGPVIANAIAGPTVFLLPSVFGFLVWELQANYRLYRANRPKDLGPSIVGHHGETISALMKPGLHSGTLPKLYAKLRTAARKSEGEKISPARALVTSQKLGPKAQRRAEGSLARYQESLRDVEEAVRRFVERELLALLTASPRFPFEPLVVRGVELGSNRVRITIACEAISSELCEIAFEEQSGLLVASMPKAGFLDALADVTPGAQEGGQRSSLHEKGAAAEARLLFENGLAGLYKLAGVDLVREQIEAALGAHSPYDIADEGLIVWPGEGYLTEVIYDLDPDIDRALSPVVRGDPPPAPPPELDARQIFYRRQRITWRAWLSAWTKGMPSIAPTPRLIQGASLLPPRAQR
jgi:hypothetical protein